MMGSFTQKTNGVSFFFTSACYSLTSGHVTMFIQLYVMSCDI